MRNILIIFGAAVSPFQIISSFRAALICSSLRSMILFIVIIHRFTIIYIKLLLLLLLMLILRMVIKLHLLLLLLLAGCRDLLWRNKINKSLNRGWVLLIFEFRNTLFFSMAWDSGSTWINTIVIIIIIWTTRCIAARNMCLLNDSIHYCRDSFLLIINKIIAGCIVICCAPWIVTDIVWIMVACATPNEFRVSHERIK